MTIVAAHSVSHFFFEAVEDAMRLQRVDATDGATRYLVALLGDYVHPDRRAGEALERPLTLLFDEAVHAPDPADRFQRLRIIGDGVLYGCGFFGDHFEARGVDGEVPPRARDARVRGGGRRCSGARPAETPATRADPTSSPSSPGTSTRSSACWRTWPTRPWPRAWRARGGCSRSTSGGSRREATGSRRALTSHGVVPTRGTRGVLQ